MFEVKISQHLKEYREEIVGTVDTYEEAKAIMDAILTYFPKTKVTISMHESNDNIKEEEDE